MLEGGGGCLLRRTGTLVQDPAQLLCRNQLHNPHLACAGCPGGQSAGRRARPARSDAEGDASRAGMSPGRLQLWTGTESGLAFVEHTAAGP